MAQKVHEIMTANPATVSAQTTVSEAARVMRDANIGDVLITEAGQLRGVLTDRDIVVRAVAHELPVDTRVQEICSPSTVTCAPSDDIDRAVALMREHGVRRLPVVDADQLVGVLSLGDLAIERDHRSALADISAARPNR
ncbi:CBS domain-containing protein [Actinospica sp.]|jgi:CBS domain-containing protein|uniref:CBS domain-containing protein n=1 Tax=Actinospica sp. TaxID=1872142 RepID=UPI002BEE7DF5|nr:CBS domain-containing protein [Actinospica sp.]HWG23703.1 CBS domain-containing protein [Actinospica sp.]